jgi:cytochrome c oxidase subunit 2
VSRRPTQPLWVCLRAVLVLAAVVLLGGCALDGPMSTFVARSDLNRSILSVYKIIIWATTIIGLLVFTLLAVILLRYRDRPGAALPRQIHGHTAMEISWTIAPALILLIIAIPTIQVIFKTQSAASPKNALEVTVRGWQWWWEFRYPTLDVATANEVHLPVGRPIVFSMEGPDVIHSLWIPQLGGKRDVVPGRVNRITLTPDTPGEYWGQCAEYCGTSHANMMLRVIVEEPAAFDKWVAAQKAPSRPVTPWPARTSSPGTPAWAATPSAACRPACSGPTSRTSAAASSSAPACGRRTSRRSRSG